MNTDCQVLLINVRSEFTLSSPNRVLVLNQLSMSGRHLFMSFYYNFMCRYLFNYLFIFHVTYDVDSSALRKIIESKMSESMSSLSKSPTESEFIHNCRPSPSTPTLLLIINIVTKTCLDCCI